MKPIISKTPEVPELTQEEIEFLTAVTFGEKEDARPCDALFVFGGTHSGHWEKAIEAYQKGLAKRIILTGGISPTGTPNPKWIHNNRPEAEVMKDYLLAAGIPEDQIVYENRSTNTLENVLFAKEVFDFDSIESVLFVCKSHVVGRQGRTLAKHLPTHLNYVPYPFDATYKGISLSRENWMETELGRSRIWGEYLRILHYGKLGHLLELDEERETP
ncbi:YdcF family protein [Streptococcus cameli]